MGKIPMVKSFLLTSAREAPATSPGHVNLSLLLCVNTEIIFLNHCCSVEMQGKVDVSN